MDTDLEKIRERLQACGDMRLKYSGLPLSTSFMLMRAHPQKHSAKAAAHGLGIDRKENEDILDVDMTSIDIASILLKYLHAFLARTCLTSPDACEEGNSTDEFEWPFLRYIFVDLDQATGTQEDKDRKANALQAVRVNIAKHMGAAKSKPRLSFLQVTENQHVWERFWTRPQFLLIPEMLITREEGKWYIDQYKPLWHLARLSKIVWDCERDLGELVSSKFGFKEDPEDPSFVTVKQTGDAAILRVHMKPSYECRRTWEYVREFQFDQFLLVETGSAAGSGLGGGGRGREGKRVPWKMTLIASVHIPKEGRETLRLYEASWR